MNNSNHYLHDIELPATSLSPAILLLLTVVALLVLLIIAYTIYHQQRPIVRAKRRLRLLSTTEANPQALAMLLQQALQVKYLNDSSLPKDFLHRLDQARFSADPC